MAGQNLRFINLAIKSYARFNKKTAAEAEVVAPLEIDQQKLNQSDPENGLMIVFPEGYRTTILDGNQGTGKTSFLHAIYEVCGGDSPKNAVNSVDADKKIRSEFIGKDGKRYHLSITRTSIVLKELVMDEAGNPVLDQKGNPKVMDVKSPKTQLAELIGPAGVSPLWLANAKPEEQINWLRSVSVMANEIVTFETTIIPKIKEATAERKQLNATYKRLKGTLENNEYYQNWEKSESYFNNDAQFAKVDEEYAEVEKRKTQYNAAINKVELLKSQKQNLTEKEADIIEQIKKLQQELETVKASLEETNIKIATGEQFLVDNKNVEAEYTAVLEKRQEKLLFTEKKKAWEQVKGWKIEMDKASDQVINLTGKLDEYRKLQQKMIQSFTPAVEELEVCIPGTPIKSEVVNPDEDVELETRHGFYYKKMPLHQLSESELWELFTKLWSLLNIKVILVENINGLGTGAVEKFNEFVNNGGYIFATLMNRKRPSLRITWDTKIPE